MAEPLHTIFAAGGLLWRTRGDEHFLAVVHRVQHKDWTLPRGKYEDKDQTLETTAVREVGEETGCAARITDFAGVTSYVPDQASGRTKLVVFYNMTPTGEPAQQLPGEIDRTEWLTPKHAIARLSYSTEKELVQRCAIQPGRRISWWRRPFVAAAELNHHRLNAEMSIARIELESQCGRKDAADAHWAHMCRHLLCQAQEQAGKDLLDQAWRSLNAAQRTLVLCLDGGSEKDQAKLNEQATALRNEAGKKLSDWRKDTILELLKPGTKFTAETLAGAMQIRDEYFHNEYFKLHLRRFKLWIPMAVIMADILVLLLIAASGKLSAKSAGLGDPWFLATILLFGGLGGALSAVQTLASTAGKTRELLMSGWITVLRPGLGAAAALGVIVLLEWGTLDSGALSPNRCLALAFAAGFSERFIVQAVGKVTAS